MLLERSPQTGKDRISPLTYELKGTVYSGRLSALVFSPIPDSVDLTFSQWLEKRYAKLPKEARPWLEFPFREDPFTHPHFNHGNAENAGYYLVVEELCHNSEPPDCTSPTFSFRNRFRLQTSRAISKRRSALMPASKESWRITTDRLWTQPHKRTHTARAQQICSARLFYICATTPRPGSVARIRRLPLAPQCAPSFSMPQADIRRSPFRQRA